MTDAEKLAAIELLCKRHNNPSVVTSTQILAAKVLKIIEGELQQVTMGVKYDDVY